MDILRISGLTKDFGGLRALASFSMQVEAGGIHALIGPNGSGKTTCFNVISGLYRATEGRILFGTTDITDLRPHVIAALGIGRTFQRALVVPMMTCRENVMLGMYSRTSLDVRGTFLRLPFRTSRQERAIRGEAESALDTVGLKETGRRWGSELTWVECQLTQIARALVSAPKLLLLDEPTSGMGVAEARRVADVIRNIRDMGITVVLVSHDIASVTALSDWVTVISFGNKIFEGTPSQVKDEPKVVEAYLGND